MPLQTSDDHTALSFQYMQVGDEPETLIQFLLRKFRYLDQQQWLQSIELNRVLLDGGQVAPDRVLKNGQIITYLRPDFLEPEVDPTFQVVYEDEVLIAVNKSGNLPTSPSGRYYKNTLVHLLKQHLNTETVYTVHRLDRETSGLLVFAKDKKTAASMGQFFQRKQVNKTYHAIVSPALAQTEVEVEMPIGKLPDSQIRIKQGFNPQGKPSRTRFRLLETFANHARVEAVPLTGRTHQIRVHAAHLGCPIAGDKLYSQSEKAFIHWINNGNLDYHEMSYRYERQLLHACRLQFPHPVSQEPLELECDDAFLMQSLPFELQSEISYG